jgi:hypothetical protein
MNPVAIRQIPHGLPSLLCENRRLRNDIAVLLELKALHPDSRFKADLKTLNEHATLCGWKGKTEPFRSLQKCLYRLEQLKLCRRERMGGTDCIVLCTWHELLDHFGLPRDMRKAYRYPRNNKKMFIILMELFMQEERKRFEIAKETKINRDLELQETLRSVCSADLKTEEIAYGQLRLFCDHRFGEIEGDAEYLLLYARAAKGRFYFKADTHISTEHYSKRMGYKNKNGFCYYSKQMQDDGYMIKTRREYVIQKHARTNQEQRRTGIGTFFRDSKTGENKLRMTDAIEFINPGIDLMLVEKKRLAERQKLKNVA